MFTQFRLPAAPTPEYFMSLFACFAFHVSLPQYHVLLLYLVHELGGAIFGIG